VLSPFFVVSKLRPDLVLRKETKITRNFLFLTIKQIKNQLTSTLPHFYNFSSFVCLLKLRQKLKKRRFSIFLSNRKKIQRKENWWDKKRWFKK
jgi:hypothetical protein